MEKAEGRAAEETFRCAVHGEAAAVALCMRCGDAVCARCMPGRSDKQPLCSHCNPRVADLGPSPLEREGDPRQGAWALIRSAYLRPRATFRVLGAGSMRSAAGFALFVLVVVTVLQMQLAAGAIVMPDLGLLARNVGARILLAAVAGVWLHGVLRLFGVRLQAAAAVCLVGHLYVFWPLQLLRVVPVGFGLTSTVDDVMILLARQLAQVVASEAVYIGFTWAALRGYAEGALGLGSARAARAGAAAIVPLVVVVLMQVAGFVIAVRDLQTTGF